MKGHDISKRVYNTDGVSPNINARSETAKVTVKGNISPKGFHSMDILGTDGIAKTLLANGGGNTEPKIVVEAVENYSIRKLTPKECWRLMGWKDEQFNKIKGISNSQLYKQAGNGIVIPVLERIFENLFKRRK